MIRLVAVVSLRGRESRTLRLWVPLIVLWLVIVPLAVSFFPANFCCCVACRINPVGAFSVGWQISARADDTEFEIEHRSAGISICVF